MTKQEILNAFLQADKDFEDSKWIGLCNFFTVDKLVSFSQLRVLKSYWVK